MLRDACTITAILGDPIRDTTDNRLHDGSQALHSFQIRWVVQIADGDSRDWISILADDCRPDRREAGMALLARHGPPPLPRFPELSIELVACPD